MKLTLELYEQKYIIESPQDDWTATQLTEEFSKLLVCAGFTPDVLQYEDDAGHFEYVRPDEAVVKKGVEDADSEL